MRLRKVSQVVLLACIALTVASSPALAGEALDADDCVALALRSSAEIAEADAKVKEWEARLLEVESIFYPKLQGIGFVAPMFTVKGINDFEPRYKSLRRDWGPYTRLELILAQPLYTFGRATAGEAAARHRAAVEKARVREAELTVALEVRKLYYKRSYALSLQPILNTGAKVIAKALEQGQEMFDEGTGEVTQADLSKLEYAAIEIAKFQLRAREGAKLALSALKHTIGLGEDDELELLDQKLPKFRDDDPQDLAQVITEAGTLRPEWAQLEHGAKAAEALERAHKLGILPVVFVAGQFRAAWTPTRGDTKNPYYVDEYNEVFGGVAVGLMFDIDPALSLAKAEGARALALQVEALHRFADTGIPLRARKAYQDVHNQRELTTLSKTGVKAARKWMMFSAAAYMTGAAEAKDVLEGVGAFLQAKKGYYDGLLGYHIARAELDFAVGR
ncbi:MAG: TolC family protein [Myxococcota bacterium]